MVEISQKKSFTEGFGEVLRSSAIFYVRQYGGVSTTISFMDYWRSKRGLEVAIIATTRKMNGRKIGRTRLRFDGCGVINFQPFLGDEDEGSVEIEIFALENLVNSYPAIMAFYETEQTISMVHSYARAYSRNEVEEGDTITLGEESNWTVRDSDSIRSFCLFHNGAVQQPSQMVNLTIKTLNGRCRIVDITLNTLAPYETCKICPSDSIADLSAFLDGSPGQATISFRLGESFTRMLVGNEAVNGSDLQVTHSDFNFNIHNTDHIGQNDASGLLRVPKLHNMERWVVVYPGQDPGDYSVSDGVSTEFFVSGEPKVLNTLAGTGMFEFKKTNGPLPTRINVGIGCTMSDKWLPAEPSLGVMHVETPAKRLTWGPCILGSGIETDIIIHSYDRLFGALPQETELCFRLYSATCGSYLEHKMGLSDFEVLDRGVPVGQVFPDAESFLAGAAGYFTIFSDYGGFKAYVLMKKPSGSATLEHTF